jgi:transposase
MTNQKVVKKHRDRAFRMDAAKLVVDGGRKASEVANDVGVTAQSVNGWVKAYMALKAQPAMSAEALQLKAANEEIRKLKMQVDFLKKTTAYFANLSE